MFKSFLILMLTATQLLAGSGGSVYLCIKDDGSFCCLDTGAMACRRCEEAIPAAVEPQSSGCSCCSETAAPKLPTAKLLTEDDTSTSSELTLASPDPCGCTHVLIAQDQAQARANRISAQADVQQLVQMTAQLPASVALDGVDGSRNTSGWQYRPPTVESQALTVRLSVQIRC
ncbi:MAG: hypothetical protein V4719_02595 [Planctomycetota bacterium]